MTIGTSLLRCGCGSVVSPDIRITHTFDIPRDVGLSSDLTAGLQKRTPLPGFQTDGRMTMQRCALPPKLMLWEGNNHDIICVLAFRHAHVPPAWCTQQARTFTEADISDNRVYRGNLGTCATITE